MSLDTLLDNVVGILAGVLAIYVLSVVAMWLEQVVM
jgi:hypothetical protein